MMIKVVFRIIDFEEQRQNDKSKDWANGIFELIAEIEVKEFHLSSIFHCYIHIPQSFLLSSQATLGVV